MSVKTKGDELLEELLAKSTAEPELDPSAYEESEEEKDVTKLRQRTPPKRGLCRRCGQNKPVNRLMLCYPCWVKTELEAHGWREGMEHPSWCRCSGVEGHAGKKSNGN